MAKKTVQLPNPGCEYIGNEYDKDKDMWLIKYRQKPGHWPMVIKKTDIPLPTDNLEKIMYVEEK